MYCPIFIILDGGNDTNFTLLMFTAGSLLGLLLGYENEECMGMLLVATLAALEQEL